FKKELPGDAYGWANGQLKRVLETLAPARSWDVFVDEMVGRLADEGKLPHSSAFQRAAAIARMRAHLQARDAVASTVHTTALLELMRWFEMRGWRNARTPATKRLDRRIDKCAGRLLDRQFD